MSANVSSPQAVGGGVGPQRKNITMAEVTENDVLCGRGGSINCHPGNEQFRQMVQRKKRIYLTARFKREKRLIASSIVDEIKALNPPGRFLSRIEQPGRRRRKGTDDLGWYEVDDDKARDKTSQALRENAPDVRKEMEVERKKYVAQQQQFEKTYTADDEDDYEEKISPPDDEMDVDEDTSENMEQVKESTSSSGWYPQVPDIHISQSWSSFKTKAAAFMSHSGDNSQAESSGQEVSQSSSSVTVRPNGSSMEKPVRHASAQPPQEGHGSSGNPNRVVHFQDDNERNRELNDQRMDQLAEPWETHAKQSRLRVTTKTEPPYTCTSNGGFQMYSHQQNSLGHVLPDGDQIVSSTSYSQQMPRYPPENTSFGEGDQQLDRSSAQPDVAPSSMVFQHQSVQQQGAQFPPPLHSPINVSSNDHGNTHAQQHLGSHPPNVASAHNPYCQNFKSSATPNQAQENGQQKELQQPAQLTGVSNNNMDMHDVEPIPLNQIEKVDRPDQNKPGGSNAIVDSAESRIDTEAARAGCDAWMHPDWLSNMPPLFCGSIPRTDSIDDFSFCGNLDTCSVDSPIGGSSLCNVFIDNEPHNKGGNIESGRDGTFFHQYHSSARHDDHQMASDKSIDLKSDKSEKASEAGILRSGSFLKSDRSFSAGSRNVDINFDPALTLPMEQTPSIDNMHHMNIDIDHQMGAFGVSWDGRDGKKINE